MKRIIVSVVGIVLSLLGLLWFLQGTGIIHLRPVLCVADCEVITGTSLTWAIAGAITVIVGIGMAYLGLRYRKPNPAE
jgi:ABC-type Fe3+ transport system permease subunit